MLPRARLAFTRIYRIYGKSEQRDDVPVGELVMALELAVEADAERWAVQAWRGDRL